MSAHSFNMEFDRLANAFFDELARFSGSDEMRQPRTDWVGEDDLDPWQPSLEEPADAGDRAAGADAAHEVADLPATLLENLRPGRLLMDPGIGRMRKLIG